ncbi:MAG: tyrosine-type recombinase/integrase [Bacteroidota bacterium]
MSLQSFVAYLSHEKNYSTHTVVAYERDVVEFTVFCNDMYGVDQIEDAAYHWIRSWIVKMVNSGITNRSINRKISSLKAYYKFLLKIQRITINPLSRHKVLKTAKRIEVPFSESEMENVLSKIPFKNDFEGVRDKLIIELLYTAGIRRAELINLKINDFDTVQKTLKVLGKRNKERVLPLLPSTSSLFNEYLKQRFQHGNAAGVSYVFLTSAGHKIYETLVYRVINKYLGMVSPKVKKSPHILRHTFATHLLNKGADLNSVKELLGHTSLASTQVYTHNSIAELKEVHSTAHPRNKE